MADPLGKFLFGALAGWMFRADRGAEKRLEQREREERKEIERAIRRMREEKRLLLMQRVYNVLQAGLTQEVKVLIGKLSMQVQLDQAAINKLAADVTRLIAKEIGRED